MEVMHHDNILFNMPSMNCYILQASNQGVYTLFLQYCVYVVYEQQRSHEGI